MVQLTPEKLKELYDKLPKDLKDAYFDLDLDVIIQLIGKKHKLMIDKMGELADETGLVMLGFTHPKNFIPNLSRRLNVDSQVAKEIAEEINKQVFSRVRDSLKQVHKIGGEKPAEAVSAEGSQKQGVVPVPPLAPKTDKLLRPLLSADGSTSKVPEVTPDTQATQPAKEDILKEIEEIEKGDVAFVEKKEEAPLMPTNPFEAKTKEGVFRVPAEEKDISEPKQEDKYQGRVDPYRESIN